jgi:hypothetical protein
MDGTQPTKRLRSKTKILEDRRPCANMDPYVVARLLMETVCG